MYRIIACLTQDHHYGLLSLAVAICVVGSILTVILLRRMVQANSHLMWFLWALSSLIGGTTIWSTHFIAMLAYDPGVEHSYDFKLTFLSLALAVIGLFASGTVFALEKFRWRAPVAGVSFGIVVSAMHYLGMAAYQLPAQMIWEADRVTWSIAAGATMGTFAYHRILHPVTRYCWLGGAACMILAISAMHFMGMTAFTILLDGGVNVPPEAISDWRLGILVTGITATLFLVGFVSYSIEINLERETKSHLRYAALHDQLTGLPNRLKLASVLEKTAARLAKDKTHQVAVLSIDLDRFKQINDMHGHAAGDTVLVQTAQRLMRVLQSNEFIARTGGDEFVVIKDKFRHKDEAVRLANRLHDAILEPIDVMGAQFLLGASIGISNTSDDGRNLDALLLNSDKAMYRAKRDVDTHIVAFDAEIDRKDQDRKSLANDLKDAVQNGEFELVYQLQNSLTTLDPIGFECLLRWNHPSRGRVPPSIFIPLAEETGLIRDIGLWVMRTACQAAVNWPHPYSVAVNVAPQQLAHPSFVEQVSDILFETALAPHRLELEITESSMINDQANTLRVMHELKRIGLRIAMDDFGTGYSSLATLQAFPFDKIKIDRGFITEVHMNEQRAAIVRATLLLGAALNIPILAEGVETELELDFLRGENCNSVQGFYFGQPLHTDELDALMREISVTNVKVGTH